MDSGATARKSSAARAVSLSLKAAIVLVGVLGQFVSIRRNGFLCGVHFLYFTNISNVLSILCAAAFFVYEWRDTPPGAGLLRLRFMAASGIALVNIVFALLLSPRMDAAYRASIGNIILHYLLPLLSTLDFVLLDDGYADTRRSPLPGLTTPLAYYFFILLLSRLGAFFGGGARFPYFFIDDAANGWFTLGGGRLGVAWWVLLIALAQLMISWALLFLQKRMRITKTP